MEIVLEALPEVAEAPKEEITTAADAPEPPPAPPDKPELESVEEAPVIVKRPRGRPKGKAAPKAPPKAKAVPKAPTLKRSTARRQPEPEHYSDSEEEEMVGRLLEDDMETQILAFLTARKRDQESKRRSLWQNLASSGLHR